MKERSAQLLKSSPDVAYDFIDAADVWDGKLNGYDVLVMPGGKRKGMWRAALLFIERFKALGYPIHTT